MTEDQSWSSLALRLKKVSQMADKEPFARLLIVEDSPTQAKNLIKLLKSLNFSVEAATNGEEALRLLDGGGFELIVSDVLMPRMNGYEMCRRIKANALRSNLPVILLTSLNGEVDRNRAVEAGADAFLTKPFQAGELESTIHELLDKSRKPIKRVTAE